MAVQPLKHRAFYLRAAGLLLLALLAVLLYSADSLARQVTAPLRGPVCCQSPADFGAGYQSITFQTADGLTLSGWYVPPTNGAVIILLHAYFGDRRQTLPVAAMLQRTGYGLLMYDQRATGESQGGARSLGWRDIPDLGAAAGWLLARDKNLRLGAYGCSVGGGIALAGAVNLPAVRAVAADAPSSLGWQENLPAFNPRDPLSLPLLALYYPLVMLRSGSLPPGSSLQAVHDYGARPLLLISSGEPGEQQRIDGYAAAALGPLQRWNIPDAGHCGGPAARPQEYARHLLDFFNTALR